MGIVYIFIDEVQYISEWERFVNSHAQDFAEPCEIFVTGSNSNLLSTELATLLSGRYVQIEVFPYSYEEYCGVQSLEKGRSSYLQYLQAGALPELLNLWSEEARRSYVFSVKDTVMLRDIVARNNIKGKEIISARAKYYLNDLSFHNYLYAGFRYGLGYILENAVYLHLRQEVYVGNIKTTEVDFVAIKGFKKQYF